MAWDEKKEEIDYWLDSFLKIQSFCTTKDDLKIIDSLTQKANFFLKRGVFASQTKNSDNHQNLYTLITEKIQKGRKSPPDLPRQSKIEEYRFAIEWVRAGFNEGQDLGDCSLKTFLMKLINDVFVLCGPPPCCYDMRALGSIGKEESTPYSDLEVIFLIEDEERKEYFYRLAQVFNLLVISLDESQILPVTFTCLPNEPRAGFHLDRGANPSVSHEFIYTKEDLLTILKKPIQDDFVTTPAHDILKSYSLHTNDSSLFTTFQKEMEKIDNENKRKEWGRALLKHRLQEFKKSSWRTQFLLPNVLDLKQDLFQFLAFFMSDLGIYYKIKEKNSRDIIKKLVERGIFHRNSGLLLQNAVKNLLEMRIKVQTFYQEPKEKISLMTPSTESQAKPNEFSALPTKKIIAPQSGLKEARPEGATLPWGKAELMGIEDEFYHYPAEQCEVDELERLSFFILNPLYQQLSMALETDFEQGFKDIDLIDLNLISTLKLFSDRNPQSQSVAQKLFKYCNSAIKEIKADISLEPRYKEKIESYYRSLNNSI